MSAVIHKSTNPFIPLPVFYRACNVSRMTAIRWEERGILPKRKELVPGGPKGWFRDELPGRLQRLFPISGEGV